MRKVSRMYHCVNQRCQFYDESIEIEFPTTGHAVIVGTVLCDECGYVMRGGPDVWKVGE